jgi:ATP synthase protein I
MTQPQASGRAYGPPFAAMLRGALSSMVATAPVIVLAFWITSHARGGLAALLGVVIAVVFFAGGLSVMKRVINSNPLTVLAGALAVFFGQVILLGFVILVLSGADWLDGRSFGLAMLAVALVWQLSQVVVFIRLRKPVYDVSADEAAAAPADEPTRVLPPEQDPGMSR